MVTIRILDPTNHIRTFEGATPMKDLVTDLMNRTDWVILDTETTGLSNIDEAVSIGVIDHTGNVLLDTLVKPANAFITQHVAALHGITQEMVSDAPTFLQVLPDLHSAVAGKTIVVYNAPFDRRIIAQSVEPYIVAAGYPEFGETEHWPMYEEIATTAWLDIMAPYAEFHGEWNEYHQSYRWQRLTAAAAQMRVPIVAAHRAVGDCIMTLGVIRAVYNLIRDDAIEFGGGDPLHCVQCGEPVADPKDGLCADCYAQEYPDYSWLDID